MEALENFASSDKKWQKRAAALDSGRPQFQFIPAQEENTRYGNGGPHLFTNYDL